MDDIQARLLNAGFRAGYRLGFDDALHGGPRDSDAKASLFLTAVESAQTELEEERATQHITNDGVTTLCGVPVPEQQSATSTIWCAECLERDV